MVEPDAAGPALPDGHTTPPPKASRPISIAAAVRQMKRQAAPLRAEMARAEKLRRQIEAFTEPARRLAAEFGLDEADAATAPTAPVEPVRTSAPEQKPEPLPAKRPAFEESPAPALLAALREAFPGFKPTNGYWFHVEKELKNAHHRGNPEGHDAFCAAYRNWSAKDLIRHLEAEGRIRTKQTGRKHKRNVEGLDVHQWVMAVATKDRTFRHLSQVEAAKLGPFSARCIGLSWAWRKMKEDLKAEADESADRAAAELADRHGEDEDANGLRQSSTKHGIGIQRATAEDLKHDRDAKAFLAKAGHRDKRRTK